MNTNKINLQNKRLKKYNQEQLKEYLEENKETDFTYFNFNSLDLTGINLSNRNLLGAIFKNSNLTDVNFSGSKLKFVSFEYADLSGTIFNGADISETNFLGACIREAVLEKAINYTNNRSVFLEAIRRTNNFTESEWATIGKINIHSLYWNKIFEQFASTTLSIFQKLAANGFVEWEIFGKDYLINRKTL
jgi:uncharacterized protein YjbI with pentapeptide repeats